MVIGPGARSHGDHRMALGSMPPAVSLAGLPLVEGSSSTAGGGEDPPVAASMLNLLPLASSMKRLPAAGTYVGDGMPPVPAKLAEKIKRWEYVEMGELLPEFWASAREGEGDGKERRARQSRKVTDINSWLQCYAVYVAILGPQEPQVVPELMAYMAFMIRVSQDYEGLGWVRYDSAFRRQAALSCNKKWSTINPTLFSMNFAVRASAVRRCELCFATTHSERECAQFGDKDPDVGDRLRSLETAVLALTKPKGSSTGPGQQQSRLTGEVCRKWNGNGCTFPRCRFLHVCSGCGGGHPVTRCGMRGGRAATAVNRPGSHSY